LKDVVIERERFADRRELFASNDGADKSREDALEHDIPIGQVVQ